jgi:hypothetical protein
MSFAQGAAQELGMTHELGQQSDKGGARLGRAAEGLVFLRQAHAGRPGSFADLVQMGVMTVKCLCAGSGRHRLGPLALV